ncbi:MAG TPA: STAS domain-containing protein [Candidatus Baltobacteraceae bacterium]|jgi:anti-anti-sigma factor|nr:STAS domain-containing protein [Candidatus Baltobacteraceae bacterium]
MPHDALSVDIKSEHGGDAIIYRLRGSLDLATSPSLRAALIEAADEGKHDIVVDLSQLEFLDSTGLGALIGAHKRALEHGGQVRLVVNDGPIQRLLTITGLMGILSVYGSLDAALNGGDRLVASF